MKKMIQLGLGSSVTATLLSKKLRDPKPQQAEHAKNDQTG